MQRLIPLMSTAVLVACLTGCSNDDPDRYRLTGTVSFDGKPLEHGMIYFDPVTEGPAGYARISGGTFDTSLEGGKGHIGGPIRVRIKSHSPTDGDETQEVAPPPFAEEYIEEVELPQQDSEKSFEIPANADELARARQKESTYSGP